MRIYFEDNDIYKKKYKLNAQTHSDNKNLDTNVLNCLENTVTIKKKS